MKVLLVVLLVAVALLSTATAQTPTLPDDAGGYVMLDEKNGSQMFWWFQGFEDATKRDNAPLIIWLQGGPGGSSLFGDLCEIGKIDACDGKAKPRQYSWHKLANLLFFDNPVGTGFSFTTKSAGYLTTDEQIGQYLLAALTKVLQKMPQLSKAPLYIFSESYGGKMNSYFGVEIAKAIQKGQLQANFKGVALGDSWIHPADICCSYGTFLESISHMNPTQAAQTDSYCQQINDALKAGKGDEATYLWGAQQNFMGPRTAFANAYNFLMHTSYDTYALTLYANTVFKTNPIYSIPKNVTWQMSTSSVFSHLSGTFMYPSTEQVDYLLTQGFEVIVYSGQLDFIVDTAGTNKWLYNRLNWTEIDGFKKAERKAIHGPKGPKIVSQEADMPYKMYMNAHAEVMKELGEKLQIKKGSDIINAEDPKIIDNTQLAFRQQYKNLDYWTILYAGHMVPMENPSMAFEMVKRVLNK